MLYVYFNINYSILTVRLFGSTFIRPLGEHGTLFQLRNMIGRINVSADPIRRFNECEDFFKLIINCFLLVAAMKFLKMTSLSDVPSLPHVNQANELWMESAEK